MPIYSGAGIGTADKDARWLFERDQAQEGQHSGVGAGGAEDVDVTNWLIEVTGRKALHSKAQQRLLLEEMGLLENSFRMRILAYLQEKEALMRRLSERALERSVGAGSTSMSKLSGRMTTNRPLLLGGGEAIVLRLLQSLHVNGDEK